jgi:hypothetical protein
MGYPRSVVSGAEAAAIRHLRPPAPNALAGHAGHTVVRRTEQTRVDRLGELQLFVIIECSCHHEFECTW